ncbi:MAG: TonB family protein [candidate division KSB1 bacterium]|nr:TonB family protein [candidate division KSB1 bacterium]MDZ7366821.1 TonB family protein [candidate division KSB1 bacterium]MDZ7405172.1 TonB family protein [candidate division KSB1 bacterium]
MKLKQNLKLRIEQNGKVTDRYLRGKEEFTVGRNLDNDVVLYGEKFPKRLRMFVPTNGGYELRLADETRGEVVYDKSRLTFSDLLQHDLLPKHDGRPTVPLTPGKSGHLILDGVRIDFDFDGENSEALQFEGYSPVRAFTKSLKEDTFFKTLIAVLIVMQFIAVQWAGSVKIAPPESADQTRLFQKVQKIAATFKSAEELRPKTAARVETKSSTESSKAEKDEEKKDETKTAETREKKGFGSDKPGEGVDVSNMGALVLLGGTGDDDGSSDLIRRLTEEGLAKSVDKVMAGGKLSAGRGESNSNADLDKILAFGELGSGKGGNSSIEDILKNDVNKNKPAVKLEKTGKARIEELGKVSGSQEAMGARTEESLRKVLSENMGRLTYIYNKYLKTHPDMGGKVEVEVTIAADGSVANALILSSEIPIEDFKREILSAIRRWKYDAITQGQVKVVYPIIFIKTN